MTHLSKRKARVKEQERNAIFEYLRRLDDNGNGKVKASIEAAKLVFIESKHHKTVCLINDENIVKKCHTWILSQGGTTTLLKFKEFVEEKLLVNSRILKKKTIGIATAVRWLNVLGYSFQSQKQGIYYDGHERPDVIRYRQLFLDTMFSYEKYMSKYEGENMEWIPLILESNGKEIIHITHDECIFYSNNGKRRV
ncbi:1432_t:CDS:2 [Funneliformis geosporum]|nr:1432_t:CDS:2 [Funneliformis geosporum]